MAANALAEDFNESRRSLPPSGFRTDKIAFMTLSARNHLKGTVEEVVLGTVMAHVVVRVGDNLIDSAITRRSADEMKLKKGDTVYAIIKSTEVMIEKE